MALLSFRARSNHIAVAVPFDASVHTRQLRRNFNGRNIAYIHLLLDDASLPRIYLADSKLFHSLFFHYHRPSLMWLLTLVADVPLILSHLN